MPAYQGPSERPYETLVAFVVLPDDLLERHDEIRDWFVRSREWVGAKEPK